MSPDAPVNGGTGLYRYKDGTRFEWEQKKRNNKKEMDSASQDVSKWELVDKVGNIFNRLVIFNANHFHCSMDYFGNDKEDKCKFILDNGHTFHSRKPKLVCGNTADMLSETRFKKYFEITGNKSSHYGLFDCEENCPEPSPKKSTGCC